MILFLLPFLSSGFVQTQTMPDGLRQFAEYQPFTPVADTVRGLLTNAAVGDHAIAAIAWSVSIALVGLPLGHPPLQPTPSSRTNVSGIIQHHG